VNPCVVGGIAGENDSKIGLNGYMLAAYSWQCVTLNSVGPAIVIPTALPEDTYNSQADIAATNA
jgi:hypothetical protein